MFKPLFLILTFALFVFTACNQQAKTDYFEFDIPSHIEPFNQPTYNKATVKGVALGKKLFFDPILSGNNSVSCASCHQPNLAFSDGIALRKSAISGNMAIRNTPALFNLGFMDHLFWDGGVPNLEFLSAGPIGHADEMNQNLKVLEKELNASSEYKILFRDAFGIDSIEFSNVGNALAQYQRSLISFNAKYDRVGVDGFNGDEKAGYQLYKTLCSSCHTDGLFTDNSFHNNGIDSVFENDTVFGINKGRFRITKDSADMGLYKTPSLRNLGFTAPYMHDGRFKTLEDVLGHYSKVIKKSRTLDTRFSQPNFNKLLNLTKNEKLHILTFLNSLNDTSFIKNSAIGLSRD